MGHVSPPIVSAECGIRLVMTISHELSLRRKRGYGVSLTVIPSVIQCAVYLSQREVDTLEKGDKAGALGLGLSQIWV